MNEPLNNASRYQQFTGKTHNNHPHWHDQPLRLTKEQYQNPISIFNNFFESYHLHEVRETLWTWMVEVISSPHGISTDHHERNNHIYFYEKIEALVEASFLIKKKTRKHNHRQKRKQLKRKAHPQL